MPTYSYLEYKNIPCPYCGQRLQHGFEPEEGYITFQWGYCPSRQPSSVIYKVGDQVYWKPSFDGVVRGWITFAGHDCNVGNPEIEHLYVKDVDTDVAHFPRNCSNCKSGLGGAAIEIKNGKVIRAWALKENELDYGEAEVFELKDEIIPRPEYEYKAFEYWEEKNTLKKLTSTEQGSEPD